MSWDLGFLLLGSCTCAPATTPRQLNAAELHTLLPISKMLEKEQGIIKSYAGRSFRAPMAQRVQLGFGQIGSPLHLATINTRAPLCLLETFNLFRKIVESCMWSKQQCTEPRQQQLHAATSGAAVDMEADRLQAGDPDAAERDARWCATAIQCCKIVHRPLCLNLD
jgi:hypothetical protein